ncbi:hypothetical protein M446_3915 [Methylobacterium sp. 4-46]|uniref:hypothetical protein n=1 Tax=unclassified Methylobacterium TaxID=2615210 RepID=UPI000165C5B6|nr:MULTISPECIES: hypothetical protein [Methylobacterium]ACA18281.1 hypothetical protein M446_3915 [Methylobacterium sp. 4-46]WFT77580.1 hypothetical protein QA634_19890 [Methylobacterium nodulans]
MSRSAIWRAISAGRLAAQRREDGEFRIAPAELQRVYPRAAPPDNPLDQEAQRADAVALRLRLAAAEAEIGGLREMVEELRRARDQWQQQAERLTRALAALGAHR